MIPCGACAHPDVCIQGCACAVEAQTSVKIFQDMRAGLVGANARHKLAAFGAAVLKSHRNDGEPGDVDGGTLQELAEKAGVIEQRTVTEACGEGCQCAYMTDFPARCFFVPDDVAELIKD